MNVLHPDIVNFDAELIKDGVLLKIATEAVENFSTAAVRASEVVTMLEARILDADAFSEEGRAVRFSVGGQYARVRSEEAALRRRARHVARLATAAG